MIMGNIWQNKIFAMGMLIFFSTKILTRIPFLSEYLGGPVDEFLSGAGAGLILVGLISFVAGEGIQKWKKGVFSKLK